MGMDMRTYVYVLFLYHKVQSRECEPRVGMTWLLDVLHGSCKSVHVGNYGTGLGQDGVGLRYIRLLELRISTVMELTRTSVICRFKSWLFVSSM
jgi:hypothetical protein